MVCDMDITGIDITLLMAGIVGIPLYPSMPQQLALNQRGADKGML